MADLFAAVGVTGISTNVSTLLLSFISISLVMLAAKIFTKVLSAPWYE